MPVINAQMSSEEATARTVERLTAVTLAGLLEGERTDRKYLFCTMLHAKKCTKTTTFYKVSNGQRSKHETAFNRFIMLGVLGSDKIVAVFTTNQSESVQLLRYCNKLLPGALCAVLRPKFECKYMGSSSATPIINTVEPFVPMTLDTLPIIPCPRIVSSADFLQFLVHTRNLSLTNVDALAPVCNGLFCDGQLKTDCPCLEIDNRRKDWATSADINCYELFHPATIRSKRLISFFAPLCRNADPSKNNFDVLDLADCVEACVSEVNGKNGWLIFGWVKPTEAALESTNYDFELHVVSIRPKVSADISTGEYKILRK